MRLSLISMLSVNLLIANAGAYAQGDDASLDDVEQKAMEVQDSIPIPEPEATITSPVAPNPEKPSSAVESSLNIKDKMKKVMEPNLFSGSVPPIYKRKSLDIVGKRLDLSAGEAPDEYVVQDGDTLYDICDQLLDDSDYWPKLWSLNPEAGLGIINPHFIYPGMKLRFRNEGVPSLVIAPASDSTPVGDKNGVAPENLVKESLSSIPTLDDLTAPTRVIGPEEVESNAGIDFVDMGEMRPITSATVLSPGFIGDAEGSFAALAVVVGGSSGAVLNTKKSEVILQQEQNLEISKVYSVFRKLGKVYSHDGDYVGFRYEFISQLKITSQDADANVFRGQVLLDRTGVQPGDIVLPYQAARRTVPLKKAQASKGNSQEVVGFGERLMEIGGRGSFVYLAQAGGPTLEKGKFYDVIHNIKETSPSFLRKRLPDTYKQAGRVYVLDSTEVYALAYVVSDVTEIRLGDRIAP